MKKLTASQVILIFKLILILTVGSIIVALSASKLPMYNTETILVNFADDDNYYLYDNDTWNHKLNGTVENNDPYDYILKEDYYIFFLNRPYKDVQILSGNLPESIVHLDERTFRYQSERLPDSLVLKIQY